MVILSHERGDDTMSYEFGNACYTARKTARLTQEAAAELLGVSTRSIAHYEGVRTPPDDMVAAMVAAYHSPALGYMYLSQESPTGKMLLPHVEIVGASNGAIRLRVTMRRASSVEEKLDDICWDDKITPDEEQDFKRCVDELDGMMAAILEMKCCR